MLAAVVLLMAAQAAFAAPAKEKIVWVAYGYLAQNKADRMIADFTAKYPQYEVQYVDLGEKDYLVRLDTMLASGERADMALAMDSVEYAKRASEGMFLPIEKYVTEDGFSLSDAFGDGIKPSYVDGKLYGLPYTKGGFYVFYNKDMFKAAGVKEPTDDWTWADFEKTAKALTKGEGANKVYGANVHLTWGYDIDTLPAQQEGWTLFKDAKETVPNYDDPRIKSSLELWNRMQNVDKTAIKFSTFKTEQIGSRIPFAKGQAAMLLSNWWSAYWFISSKYGSPEGASMLNFNIGVVNLPRPSAKVPNNLNATDYDYYFTVPTTAKNPKGGALLARFLITEEWSKFGTLSSYKKQDLAEFKKNFCTYVAKDGKNYTMDFSDQLVTKIMGNWTTPISVYYNLPKTKNPVGTSLLKDVFNQERELYYLGEQDLDKTISRMQSRGAEELSKK
jgi:ABC-type sugar transport system, periplasmic component